MPLSVFLSSLFPFYLVQTTWNPFQDIYPNTLGRLVLRRTVVVFEALQMNLISPYYQFEENYLFLAEQDCVFKSRVLHSASCHFTIDCAQLSVSKYIGLLPRGCPETISGDF